MAKETKWWGVGNVKPRFNKKTGEFTFRPHIISWKQGGITVRLDQEVWDYCRRTSWCVSVCFDNATLWRIQTEKRDEAAGIARDCKESFKDALLIHGWIVTRRKPKFGIDAIWSP